MYIKEFKCCICGKKIKGYANNPFPVKKGANDECCDDCNMKVVIPARLTLIRKGEEHS